MLKKWVQCYMYEASDYLRLEQTQWYAQADQIIIVI